MSSNKTSAVPEEYHIVVVYDIGEPECKTFSNSQDLLKYLTELLAEPMLPGREIRYFIFRGERILAKYTPASWSLCIPGQSAEMAV